MAQDCIIPCFVCGAVLRNVDTAADNQPSEGTEFRTYGHYGSTFWDSLDGEELVLNVCDPCLRARTDRLAQHKRHLPVLIGGRVLVGRQDVARPMVPYTGNRDDTVLRVDAEDVGTPLAGVEWSMTAEDAAT